MEMATSAFRTIHLPGLYPSSHPKGPLHYIPLPSPGPLLFQVCYLACLHSFTLLQKEPRQLGMTHNTGFYITLIEGQAQLAKGMTCTDFFNSHIKFML